LSAQVGNDHAGEEQRQTSSTLDASACFSAIEGRHENETPRNVQWSEPDHRAGQHRASLGNVKNSQAEESWRGTGGEPALRRGRRRGPWVVISVARAPLGRLRDGVLLPRKRFSGTRR
jgi:hypothetical protein